MKKSRILLNLIFTLIFQYYSYTQENETITLLPNWEINEKKSYYITKRTIGYVEDTISSIEYDIDCNVIKVTGQNSEFTMLTIAMTDPVFKALKIVPNIREIFTDSIICVELMINKRMNEFHISNVQDLYDKIDSTVQEIYSHGEIFNPIQKQAIDFLVKSILKNFENYDDIQKLYLVDIDFLLFPFKHNLPLKDTLKLNEKITSPYSAKQHLTKDIKVYLSNVNQDSLKIHMMAELNMKELKDLMKSLVKTLSKTEIAKDIKTRKEINALNEINMNHIEKSVFNFDLKTGWTKYYRKVNDIYSHNNTVKKVYQIETTVILKE